MEVLHNLKKTTVKNTGDKDRQIFRISENKVVTIVLQLKLVYLEFQIVKKKFLLLLNYFHQNLFFDPNWYSHNQTICYHYVSNTNMVVMCWK